MNSERGREEGRVTGATARVKKAQLGLGGVRVCRGKGPKKK